MTTIVRALDVGFGFTKYCRGRISASRFDCGLFPSLTPVATPHRLSGGPVQTSDTVTVDVDGRLFDVGPDSELSAQVHDARVLHRDFSTSPAYLALNLGALYYIHQPVIDLLVVGLPVNMLGEKSQHLKKLLTGTHTTARGFEVTVKAVCPVAQPLGGYVYHAMHNGYMLEKRGRVSLIIDPGFFTLDWIVATDIKPIEARSGSHEGGVSAILKAIARSLSEARNITYDNLGAIDKGLRTGAFRIASRPVDLEPHLTAANPYIEKSLDVLHNAVGNGHDIDDIVVAGGGARLFLPHIQARFPDHDITLLEDSVFANVRGFQMMGEGMAAKRKEQAA